MAGINFDERRLPEPGSAGNGMEGEDEERWPACVDRSQAPTTNLPCAPDPRCAIPTPVLHLVKEDHRRDHAGVLQRLGQIPALDQDLLEVKTCWATARAHALSPSSRIIPHRKQAVDQAEGHLPSPVHPPSLSPPGKLGRGRFGRAKTEQTQEGFRHANGATAVLVHQQCRVERFGGTLTNGCRTAVIGAEVGTAGRTVNGLQLFA